MLKVSFEEKGSLSRFALKEECPAHGAGWLGGRGQRWDVALLAANALGEWTALGPQTYLADQ